MFDKFVSQYKDKLRYDGKKWYIKTGNGWTVDTTKQRYNLAMDFFVSQSGSICKPCKLSRVKQLLLDAKNGLTGSVDNG